MEKCFNCLYSSIMQNIFLGWTVGCFYFHVLGEVCLPKTFNNKTRHSHWNPLKLLLTSLPLLSVEVTAVVYEKGKVCHLPIAMRHRLSWYAKMEAFSTCVKGCVQRCQVTRGSELKVRIFACKCHVFLLKVFGMRKYLSYNSDTGMQISYSPLTQLHW